MSKVFLFGDDIDTDVLAPGIYMARPLAELASHCLESVDPHFATTVKPGDMILAGRNFGIGSSREQAAQVLGELGVAAVVAESFGGIFYRNAINLGLPVFVSDRPSSELAAAGDLIDLDITTARLHNHRTGLQHQLEPLADFLLQLINDGGLVPHLERRFQQRSTR